MHKKSSKNEATHQKLIIRTLFKDKTDSIGKEKVALLLCLSIAINYLKNSQLVARFYFCTLP